MIGQLTITVVQGGFIAAGLSHSRSEIIWHEQVRHTTEELEGINVSLQPAFKPLASTGFDIGVIRGSQCRDEDLRRSHFASIRINDRNRWAAVIDKELVTCDMVLAHTAFLSPQPASILFAKLSVTIGTGLILSVVLLPQ